MTISVSVIIPVYRRDAELTPCLQALAAQSLPRDQYEVIIVDRSTDQSTQLIAE